MPDDQSTPLESVPQPDLPAEAPAQAETPQTAVSEALLPEPPATVEPVAEPPQAASEAPNPTPEPAPIELAEIPQPEPQQSSAQPSQSMPPSQSSSPTKPTTSATAVLPTSPQAARELLVKARAKIQTKKQQKLDKIMTLFEKKTKIVNDDVEKLLHVSDATALRYLNQLVKLGKIQRVGRTGAGVEYIRI